MGDKTKIEWCDATINPFTGCSAVSEGCRNCYAARLAATRLKHHPHYKGLATYEDGRGHWTGEIRFNESELNKPRYWRKPQAVFVCPMSDLFHKKITNEQINQVIASIVHPMSGMAHHTYIILTKRPARILTGHAEHFAEWPNLWLGVTCENQQQFDERWEYVKQIPAAVYLISHEPALGPIVYPPEFLALGNRAWLVSGGESGPRARPSHPDYFRQDRDQCVEAGVSFFFKQWGGYVPKSQTDLTCPKEWGTIDIDGNYFPLTTPWNGHDDDGRGEAIVYKVTKKAAGRLLDGRTWDEYPKTQAEDTKTKRSTTTTRQR